ncbi:gp4 [Corynebacterium phage P1201]|uniref:Gp4 n=1 Tax=Corynebacterium phage P1201 TaxID=384848 RepID=A7IY75_9CAUD|nr:gp4 [Corynebacterium phage P1201]ABF57459.1 gp4 [Corynebacterium phage P1201]
MVVHDKTHIHFNLLVFGLLSCCLAVLLSCCLAVLLSCCLAVLLSCCLAVLLSCLRKRLYLPKQVESMCGGSRG